MTVFINFTHIGINTFPNVFNRLGLMTGKQLVNKIWYTWRNLLFIIVIFWTS